MADVKVLWNALKFTKHRCVTGIDIKIKSKCSQDRYSKLPPTCHGYTMVVCPTRCCPIGSGDLLVSQAESLVTCVATTVISQQGVTQYIWAIYFMKICNKLIKNDLMK